jgi:hypothetical protein
MIVYKDEYTGFLYDHPPFSDEVDTAFGCGYPYINNDNLIEFRVPKTSRHKVTEKDVEDFFSRHSCKIFDRVKIYHIEYL